jgi:hypothetical protein
VTKVGTSKAGGTISQQAAVHPWLAADAHGNKQTNKQTLEAFYFVYMLYLLASFVPHNDYRVFPYTELPS